MSSNWKNSGAKIVFNHKAHKGFSQSAQRIFFELPIIIKKQTADSQIVIKNL